METLMICMTIEDSSSRKLSVLLLKRLVCLAVVRSPGGGLKGGLSAA